jgi:hypothetical protein
LISSHTFSFPSNLFQFLFASSLTTERFKELPFLESMWRTTTHVHSHLEHRVHIRRGCRSWRRRLAGIDRWHEQPRDLKNEENFSWIHPFFISCNHIKLCHSQYLPPESPLHLWKQSI